MTVPHIALTGGIGTGKSSVSSIFRSLGVPVFDLDRICHSLIARSTSVKDIIVAEFGTAILDKNNINRKKLASIIFSNSEYRKNLESILHPRAAKFVAHSRHDIVAAPYVVSEIPLLRDRCDYHRVLLMVSHNSLRFDRVYRRDGRSRDQVEAIIRAQPEHDSLLAMADDVIYNNHDMGALRQRVAQLHEMYRCIS